MSALPAAKEMLMPGACNTEPEGKGGSAPTRVSPWRGVGEQMLSRRRGEGGGGSSRRPWLGGLRTPYLLVISKRRKLEREKKQPELNTCRRKKSLGVDLGSLGL